MAANVRGSIAAIPTAYAGNAFRSRLEAKWAAFFDLIGWQWTYEPFDTGDWIPDFLIHGDKPFLVEIGPCITSADFTAKSAKPLAHLEHPTLVLGVSPHALTDADEFAGDYAGLLVNEWPEVAAVAFWTITSGGRIQVYQDRSWHYPSGLSWDDCRHLTLPEMENVKRLWGEAGATVQWQPT